VINPGDSAYGVDPYTGDPELSDFAGNCNLTRTAAAKVLGQWLNADPTGTGAINTMVIGDLNAYANEDPITTLEGFGYTDLNELYSGANSWALGAHSYVFDGELGTLDYAMANPVLISQVTGAAAWHINADEPSALDYNDYNPAVNYTDDEWRASDHDPVVVGLNLDGTGPEIEAEFAKIYAGFFTGLFRTEYSCDDISGVASCEGDINGISVEDGQKVFLIKSRWGNPWSRMIGSVLYIKDSEFTLTVTGVDEVGNSATETAEPEFRTWYWRPRVR
jgi:hypothetical protein